jgi:4-hydroxy-4-methyl-2-oxoglutarate aldolase
MTTPPAIPPTTTLADVLLMRGHAGSLTPPLSRFAGGGAVSGRAVTVQMAPGPGGGNGFDPLYELLSGDLSGAVVIVAGAEAASGAPWGQILARAASGVGAVAAVVAGGVRDVSLLADEGLAVWAIGEITAGAVGELHVASTGQPVNVAATTVHPGDLVIGDDGGLVVVPTADEAAVLDAAARLAAAEEVVLAQLRDGRKLTDAYAAKRAVVADIRNSR